MVYSGRMKSPKSSQPNREHQCMLMLYRGGFSLEFETVDDTSVRFISCGAVRMCKR